MRKITTREIVAAVYKRRREVLRDFYYDRKPEVPYNLKNFEDDMLLTELLVDKRTIKAKWELLALQGTIHEVSPGRGYLQIAAFHPLITAEPCGRVSERVRETNPYTSKTEFEEGVQ